MCTNARDDDINAPRNAKKAGAHPGSALASAGGGLRNDVETDWLKRVVLAILLVISAVGASRLELASLAALAPAYLLLAAGLCIIMLNYGTQVVYIPLLISLGETRRNIFLGYHYYRALIIAVAMGTSALLWALVPGEVSSLGLRNIPSILAVLVTASALGSIIGTIYARWKWVATALLVLVFGAFGGVGGFSIAGGGEDVAAL